MNIGVVGFYLEPWFLTCCLMWSMSRLTYFISSFIACWVKADSFFTVSSSVWIAFRVWEISVISPLINHEMKAMSDPRSTPMNFVAMLTVSITALPDTRFYLSTSSFQLLKGQPCDGNSHFQDVHFDPCPQEPANGH